jgi:hypothetical protein
MVHFHILGIVLIAMLCNSRINRLVSNVLSDAPSLLSSPPPHAQTHHNTRGEILLRADRLVKKLDAPPLLDVSGDRITVGFPFLRLLLRDTISPCPKHQEPREANTFTNTMLQQTMDFAYKSRVFVAFSPSKRLVVSSFDVQTYSSRRRAHCAELHQWIKYFIVE